MADRARWQRLDAELARWEKAGRVADLWLRDDDAVEPTAPLERLLASVRRHRLPATLAVIPAIAQTTLAERLTDEPGIAVAVHGWAHHNHAPADGKKEELGSHRRPEAVLSELARGKAVIDGLFGGSALPMLVPPWNRIDDAVVPLLGGLGFRALSVFGRAGALTAIRTINTHVDLIDWHGSRKCKDQGELVSNIVDQLRSRRMSGSREPVGVLAHHLAHDEAAWSFLERLFEATADNPGCRWASVRELM